MAISNNTTGYRPGVCTSSSRPTAPYEGQMIYETDTNRVLVYEGAAWVMIADTDTPPGLQLVKTQTVGSGVASVTVTGVFSSEWDSYLITWQGGTMTGDTALKLQLGSVTTGYYGAFIYGTYTPTGPFVAGDNNTSSFVYGGGGGSIGAISSVTLFNPNRPIRTSMSSQYVSYSTNFGSYTGVENSTTQHTEFTFIPFSGTMTGGTIRVYGYRN